MDINAIIAECKEALSTLYKNKLMNLILYGSWARGTATADSDIDLLVVLKGTVKPGFEIDRMIDIITDLNLKYNILLSVYPISLEEYNTVNSPLLLNIRNEGKAA